MKKGRKPEEKNKQLDLKIKEPLKNKFFKIKDKTDKYIRQIEVRKFLKDPFFWFVVIISLIMIAYQIYLIVQNLNTLPSLLPILRYNIQAPGKLIQRDYIVIYPILSSIPLITSIILTTRTYNQEKTLTKLLLLTPLLTSISLSVILIQLINSF